MPTLKNYFSGAACSRRIPSPFRGGLGRGKSIGPHYVFIILIKIYQNSLGLISPPSCRFYPSCSEYGILALRKFGLFKGMWLITKRISKCHPWHSGGYDPI